MGSGVRVSAAEQRRGGRQRSGRTGAVRVLGEAGSHHELLKRVRETRRLAIVAVYRPSAVRLAYHELYLRSLRELGFAVVVVDTTRQRGRLLAESSADLTLVRANVGWDFGSWILGLTRLQEVVEQADELLLTNDSMFGPLHPLDETFAMPQLETADFWGMTDSWQQAYHLQSFFVVLRKRVLESDVVWRFLQEFRVDQGKAYAIERGEVQLTAVLLEHGFEAAAAFPYGVVAERWLASVPERLEDIDAAERRPTSESSASQARQALLDAADMLSRGVPTNPTHLFWDTLIREFRFPFLKRELLFTNPMELSIGRSAASVLVETGYPFDNVVEAGRFVRGVRALVAPPVASPPSPEPP